MNRNLCGATFLVGLAAVGWVGFGYLGAHPLALTMTAIIAAAYFAGAVELLRFHRATASLTGALRAIPANLAHLGDWLDTLHPSLQNAVRLRIEGERVGLPGPAITPYLVGLLVMLGMLGTFLGMVVTLNGAVLTLEGATDLQSMRASLTAPIKGLGLAFGTSVAGVAASAMLGLMSALCRRERLQAAQLLDTRIATALRGFSRAHQRQETVNALQLQAQVLPEVVAKLEAMMAQMERHSQQSNARLLANQVSFHGEAKDAFAELASSVGQSLAASLAESARLTAATIQPVVETTLAGIARETTALHEKVADSVATQLDAVAGRFGGTASTVAETWSQALVEQERRSNALARDMQQSMLGVADSFEQRSTALLATVTQAHAALQADLALRDRERQAGLTQSLESMAVSLQREWQAAGAQTLVQQQTLCATLGETAREITAQTQAQASHTIGEVARLMQTVAEAPRAAAEVIGQLHQERSNSIARDNALLEERSQLMTSVSALLDGIKQTTAQQESAITALVTASTARLDRVGLQFAETVGTEAAKITAVSAQIAGGAVEVASLGEAFGFAVEQFSASNEKMITSLQRIEHSLDKSAARSDDQLAYYVAQARELIDLSIMAQKQVIGELQQFAGKPAPFEARRIDG